MYFRDQDKINCGQHLNNTVWKNVHCMCTCGMHFNSCYLLLCVCVPLGKLYVYELRSVKTPREVIDAHHSAVTCIVQQHSTKVRVHNNTSCMLYM